MINLGLNRKISNVLSKNLNDPESDIYKEISSIAGETTESDSSVNTIRKIIENGRDSITSFVNEDITELGDYAFKDCVNLEHVYLPNCTKLGNECFQNCTSLKTLLLPNYAEGINLYLGLSHNIELFVAGFTFFTNSILCDFKNNGTLNFLCLPKLECFDYESFENFKIESVIVPGDNIPSVAGPPNPDPLGTINSSLRKIYAKDELVNEYPPSRYGYYIGIDPISQLPQEIREELELCQIQI